jgi:hypothetical protein
MSFTDALTKARSEFSKGPRCSVAAVLDGHDEADQIAAALTDPDIPGSLIAKALTDTGTKVRPEAVQRHRRGLCGCPRT